MSRLNAFTTPGGEEMVILSRADFDRLAAASEALADVAAYDEVKGRLAAGEDEMVPAAVVDAILAGEHPIRVWRRHRGLAVNELAEKASLSQGYLSQIETGRRQGQVDVLKRISEALAVTVDDLI